MSNKYKQIFQRSEEKYEELKQEVKLAEHSVSKQCSRIYRLGEYYNNFKTLMCYSDKENKLISKIGRDALYDCYCWKINESLPAYLPNDIKATLERIISDFSNLKDKSELESEIRKIIGRITSRTMTEYEYDSIICETYPKIKEYTEYKNKSDERLKDYNTLPTIVRGLYRIFCLTSYDKNILRTKEKRWAIN